MVRDNGEIKCIDIGLAVLVGKDLTSDAHAMRLRWLRGQTEVFGTDCVLPPELKRAFDGGCEIEYGVEVDVYAVGLMGAEIIFNAFEHRYQHAQWLQMLDRDIAAGGRQSGLSVKCLRFIRSLSFKLQVSICVRCKMSGAGFCSG